MKTFVVFDIVGTYPSITKGTLEKAIRWAKTFNDVVISQEEENIIMHSRQSILSFLNEHWEKKTNPEFDVTMGAFEGAECAELVGLMILNEMINVRKLILSKNAALYRDDGLAVLSGNKREQDKFRKDITKLFKDFDFKIEIEVGLKIVNYLDLTLNLETNSYSAFNKPNNVPVYVNRHSNHPRTTLKAIPISINKRINKLSARENDFMGVKNLYQNSLEKANFNFDLKFQLIVKVC